MTPVAAASPIPPDLVEVGRILGAWGVRGWVKIDAFADSADQSVLLQVSSWWLMPAGQVGGLVKPGAQLVQEPIPFQVERCRVHSGVLVAQPIGFATRDQAESLRGRVIAASRSAFPPAGDETYYWFDLIGCQVVNLRDESLGEVTGVDDHGAHAILKLAQTVAGKRTERLIPFVGVYVLTVDLVARRIHVDWEQDY